MPGKAGPWDTYQVSGPLVVLPTCGPISMGLVLFLLHCYLLVKIYYFYFTWVFCLSVRTCTTHVPGARRDKKRASDRVTGLQAAIWMLGTEPGSSARAARTLDCQAISLACIALFNAKGWPGLGLRCREAFWNAKLFSVRRVYLWPVITESCAHRSRTVIWKFPLETLRPPSYVRYSREHGGRKVGAVHGFGFRVLIYLSFVVLKTYRIFWTLSFFTNIVKDIRVWFLVEWSVLSTWASKLTDMTFI